MLYRNDSMTKKRLRCHCTLNSLVEGKFYDFIKFTSFTPSSSSPSPSGTQYWSLLFFSDQLPYWEYYPSPENIQK